MLVNKKLGLCNEGFMNISTSLQFSLKLLIGWSKQQETLVGEEEMVVFFN